MSYLVLARKYRPIGFDDFVGQGVIAQTLKNAIKLDRVAHAYLFCGPRGVGKTSMARVFAKALNCKDGPTDAPCGRCERCTAIGAGQDVDVIEIDGASNRGIDEVREIRQNARYAPAKSRFKIYYIDEVHMLTEQAFNALLKTLEEPPPHVKFLMATTSVAKLPETILSRVQRFDFRRIQTMEIAARLQAICREEKLNVPDSVCLFVARRGRGSMRDALSLMDQVISFCGEKPAQEEVVRLLGVLDDAELSALLDSIRAKDAPALIRAVDELLARGMDTGELIDQIVQYLRDVLVGRVCGADQDLLDRPPDAAARIVEQGKSVTSESLLYMVEVLNTGRRRLREGQDERLVLELAFLRMAESEGLRPLSELIERMAAIEGSCDATVKAAPSVSGGARAASPPAASATLYPSGPPKAMAVREETPSAPVAVASGDADDVWHALLEQLHNGNSWLRMRLQLGRLERLDRDRATIVFPANHRSARDDVAAFDARRAIEQALSDVVGRRMSVQFALAEEAPSDAAAGGPSDSAASVSDPMVEAVRQRFGGQISKPR